MKILLIHTYYQNRGGEDSVFEQEFSLLKENAEVEVLTFHNNSGIRGGFQLFCSIWNHLAAKRVKKKIESFRPDVVHIHNWYFGSGPIIFRTIKKLKVSFVVTLHNYRLLCPSAILMNNDKLFLDSLNSKFPFRAIRYKVYKQSYILTFWLAFVNWFHRIIGTWNKVDKYIILTDFAKSLFTKSSLMVSCDKYIVKANFVNPDTRCSESVERDGFLFIGRLSEEKGLTYLLDTFLNYSYILYIGGDGPLRSEVVNYSNNHENIIYLDTLKKDKVFEQMRLRECLIFPSTCYEGMPMTIIEAFSQGLPVIASDMGAMSSMIQDGYNGFLFEAGSSKELILKLDIWKSLSMEQKQTMSKNAYDTYLRFYTPQKNKDMLLKIYKEVIKSNNDKS